MKSTTPRRVITTIIAVCFMAMQCVCLLPGPAAADASADLKNIEYKYYFRGNYERAITELRTFLERGDLEPAQIVEAKEYLAASLIFSGKTEAGKSEYLDLLRMDSSYKGPDPSVFKTAIIDTFDEAQAEYAAAMMRTVPKAAATPAVTDAATAVVDAGGKPFYRKWWFYATMGAVVLVIAGAASSSDNGSDAPKDRGTVTVEVDVP
jgi:hypothetical protein